MKTPIATYRIQFNESFTFKDFGKVKEYLKKLGVNTIYASPIFDAVPGSVHGYDVCDPTIINSEIGNEEELIAISNWLKDEGMQWLQDIVPNHMAFHPKNKWLMDVLEKGSKSLYKSYFDTVFTCPVLNGKIMVPFLGESLQEAIQKELIEIKWTGEQLVIYYFKNSYPIKPASYSFFLERLKLENTLNELHQLEDISDPAIYHEKWKNILGVIQQEFNHPEINHDLQGLIKAYHQIPEVIADICYEQHYELCCWEETNRRINYRRFFIVNGLICLNMQLEDVFIHHHQLIKKMIAADIFDGLRIDHIDGLFEPNTYLKRLRELAGKETYIIAEKILEKGEKLPLEWPIQGNTGYDFLGIVNNLFTLKSAESVYQDFYNEISNRRNIHEEELLKKTYILENHMQGELDNLCTYFLKLRLGDDSLNQENLKKAIAAFLIHIPVYRLYSENYPLSEDEQETLKNVFETIKTENVSFIKELGELEKALLQLQPEQNEIQKKAAISFFKRCMQFSGPLMAKGVEDTLMYTNFRFIAHNEVGDHPSSFGLQPDEFHHLMQNRQAKNTFSINTTATHDTKRGEDARARLNVLTALSEQWFEKVRQWQQINAQKRDELGIALHEEYFIYQCLIAHYPIKNAENQYFEERLNAYLQKAFREGKVHSDWANPNQDYENNIAAYISYLLDSENPFFQNFKDFHQKIALYGVYNSLAQLLLKFTCPGVPDVYQGSELWDFSFVDPDNRRKIDYDLRTAILEKVENATIPELMDDYQSGSIKLWLTQQLFNLRNSHHQLFTQGEYVPLSVEGKYKGHILAFSRLWQQQEYVVITVLHSALLLENQQVNFSDLDWEDTHVILTKKSSWFNVIQLNEGKGEQLFLNNFSLVLPFVVLKLEHPDSRYSGVLMHISSLPSAFGVGDLGKEAFRFADFLKQSNQHYWQLLPIGPGASNEDLSPYSTLCSMAANPLFISLELLVKEGYLDENEILSYQQTPTQKLDFKKTTEIKSILLEKAWRNYQNPDIEDKVFKQFIIKENDWLNDFALFMVLKNKFNSPWYQWPTSLKNREEAALQNIAEEHHQEILQQKWYQYIFHQQWRNLKTYCNQNGIHLIGDLPFYVNHDSSDVWANPENFSLNQDGTMKEMAGVPPDYFSAEGQLWGMPVYNWEFMQTQEYNWWIKRLRKNIRWFNLLRLDHFRAFYNYWAVEATEETAINGKWCLGPGADFFHKVKVEFPDMPFIAEDLGDINPEVFVLRDEFNLPGMKVLQFAFGEDMVFSTHIPHQHQRNFVVYTGTHDNNTIKGWFKNDLDEKGKERLSKYLNKFIDEENVANLMIQTAFSSVAKIAIIPIQDILNLDENYRMNNPANPLNNWSFRIMPHHLNNKIAQQIKAMANTYGRFS